MSTNTQNLLIPFRRDRKRDFASGAGGDLLASKVTQALMTRGFTPRSSGELPWRTAFGAGLDLLRHQRSNVALAELARVHVRDALKRWVPEVEMLGLRTFSDEVTLRVELRCRRRSSGQSSSVVSPPTSILIPIE